MNIDAIWIGDEVMVKSSRVRGWFQGKGNSGLFKIKSADGKILEVNAEEIALIGHPTKSDKNTGGIKSSEKAGKPSSKKSTILNLEYESLKNDFPRTHDRPLDYQLEVCEEFIQSLLAQKKTFCKIIFGDDAILKSSVAALLSKIPEVSIYTPHPNQDAWEVWFDDESE